VLVWRCAEPYHQRMKPNPNDWRVERYIEWLCTPPVQRDPSSTEEFAKSIELTATILRRWRSDDDFVKAWERQYRKTVGNPARIMAVMEALVETASDRTDPRMVPAAKVYLEAVGKLRPQAEQIQAKDVRKMSDDELFKILADRAEQAISVSD